VKPRAANGDPLQPFDADADLDADPDNLSTIDYQL
jgi:hypothetical protein